MTLQPLAEHLPSRNLRLAQLQLRRHRQHRRQQYPRRIREPNRAYLELPLLPCALDVVRGSGIGGFLVHAVEDVYAIKRNGGGRVDGSIGI